MRKAHVMGFGHDSKDDVPCDKCRKVVDRVWFCDHNLYCYDCKEDYALYLQENGPTVSDGYDVDGFPGGDRRHNVYPTTIYSAIDSVLGFLPENERGRLATEIGKLLGFENNGYE